MTEPNSEPSEIFEAFGLTADEIFNGQIAAWAMLGDERVKAALDVLELAQAGSTDASYEMLVAKSFSGAFGEAGKVLAVNAARDGLSSGTRWMTLLHKVMAVPPAHADTADWWLLFSALNATVEFQTTQLSAPKMEQRLTGEFLTELKHSGQQWSGLLAPMLKRRSSSFAFHQIDLERLGGEQATGGDFGLILDFDGLTLQPGEAPRSPRIIPLIFQAKRYIRPNADVSQTHKTRGPQKNYLRANKCASAYLLYENGDGPITSPLPPLVKPIANVDEARTTDIFSGTVDFASYLYRASVDPEFAPRAPSAEDALSMIYSRAAIGQLSQLFVASGSRNAQLRYQSAVAHFAATFGTEPEENQGYDGP